MKQGLFIISFLLALNMNTRAQLMPSTVREIYDFAVGDTFEYKHYWTWGPNQTESTTYEFRLFENKWYSLGMDSLFYSYKFWEVQILSSPYQGGYYDTYRYFQGTRTISYTNLDSLIMPLVPTFNCFFFCDTQYCQSNFCANAYDSVYINNAWGDSLKVNERTRWFNGRFGGSDTIYVNGLGRVYIFEADNPSSEYSELIYYHKANGERWGTPHYFTIVGIEEKPTLHATLFPNPATEQIEISIPPNALAKYNHESLLFQLFDITGRTVQSQIISSEKTIVTISQLPQGIYYWRIASAGNMLQQGRVAKQ